MSFPIDQCGNNSYILYLKDSLIIPDIQIFRYLFHLYFLIFPVF